MPGLRNPLVPVGKRVVLPGVRAGRHTLGPLAVCCAAWRGRQDSVGIWCRQLRADGQRRWPTYFAHTYPDSTGNVDNI